jgi:flagellar export protein FliJ
MRSGETLIRLAKHRVDSVHKLVASAEKTRADLEKRLADLDARAERERRTVEADPARAQTWQAFLVALKAQRANVEASIAGVDEQLVSLRADLAEAFEEQKKYETLEERRQAREAEARAKREQATLDEAAGNRYARQR